MLKLGLKVEKGMRWYGEPGLTSEAYRDYVRAANLAISGTPTQLQSLLNKYITSYQNESFKTKDPNIDIRHGSNFTGPKRGNNRCYEIPYWGMLKNII